MVKLKFQGKIKGLIEVLSSHFAVLFLTMLISFVLPLFTSVEEYGEWQLFSLIIGYAGFFALGFNDGIHVQYSGKDYDEPFYRKFRFFGRFIGTLALIGMVVSIGVLWVFREKIGDKFLIYIVSIFNIAPVLINGFFAYVNQGTMRFNKYAVANIMEKIIFIVAMFFLMIVGVKEALYYMITYTLARYCVIGYNCITSKELLISKPRVRFSEIKPEIKTIFVSGFSLMIATLFNQSIIVPGRLLVENQYGMASFSGYSFAIHTMVIANQIATAMSQVFFPAMKRTNNGSYMSLFTNLDEMVSLLSAVLLLSYFPAYILIYYVFAKYLPILEYLYCLYPLFIFTSKSLILIINTYKTDMNNRELVFNNLLGIILNAVAAIAAHMIFGTVKMIALFTLISYLIWYYFCYIKLLKQKKEPIRLIGFIDVFYVGAFIIINYLLSLTKIPQISQLFISAGLYIVVGGIAFLFFRKKCINIVKSFFKFMNN